MWFVVVLVEGIGKAGWLECNHAPVKVCSDEGQGNGRYEWPYADFD
jgi:hypothetical protein